MIRIGDYSVIADAGLSLVTLLRKHMNPTPVERPEMIGLASPADKGDLQLSLFLYRIDENGEFRQNEMIQRGSRTQQYPPLVLNLYYLLTAYSPAEIATRALDESRILGRAIQVLYDFSILREEDLKGSLALNDQELRIVPQNLSDETLISSIWKFPDVPYRLSVSYMVGPVLLDSTRLRTTSSRVTERDLRVVGREQEQ